MNSQSLQILLFFQTPVFIFPWQKLFSVYNVKNWKLFWQTADIDEKSIRKEKPEDLVMTLAEAKVNFEMIVVVAFYCFFLSVGVFVVVL